MESAIEIIKTMMEQDEQIREGVIRRHAAITELRTQNSYLRCIIEQDAEEEKKRRQALGIDVVEN